MTASPSPDRVRRSSDEEPTLSAAPQDPFSAEGSALLDAGLPLDAVDVLRQGVATGEPAAADLLVRAYLESENWHAAADWLGPLVEQGHVRFAGRLGWALLEIGDRERAEAALRLAVESGEHGAANDLATLLRDGDRLGEAVQVLVRAVEMGDPLAPAHLVALHLDAGDLPAALDVAQRHADESRPETLIPLADARLAAEDLAPAEALYRRAVELGALHAHTAYGQFLLAARGDVEGAEREFREAARRGEPGSGVTLGRFLLDDGRPGEARDHLLAAAEAGDPEADDVLAELDGDPSDD